MKTNHELLEVPKRNLLDKYHSSKHRIAIEYANKLANAIMLFALSLLLIFNSAIAANHQYSDVSTALEKLTIQFETVRMQDNLDQEYLEGLNKELLPYQAEIETCIEDRQQALQGFEADILSLGKLKEDTDPDVLKKRDELQEYKGRFEKELALCRLNELQLKKLQEEIRQTQQAMLKSQLLSRNRSIIEVTRDVIDQDKQQADEIRAITELFSRLVAWKHYWPVGILFLSGMIAGFLWKKFYSPVTTVARAVIPTLADVLTGLRRYLSWILGLALVWIYVLLNADLPQSVFKTISFALVLLLVYAALRGVVKTNNHEKKTLLHIRPFNWIFLLAATLTFLFSQETFDTLPTSNIFAYIWYGSVAVTVVSFASLLFIAIQKAEGFKNFSILYLAPLFVSIAALGAALAGYRNLTIFLLFGMLSSLLVLVGLYLFMRISSEFFDSLDEGKTPKIKNFRGLLNIDETKAFPGVIWLRILFALIFLFAAILALMSIWGASKEHISNVLLGFKDGFNIGEIHFDPLYLIYAVITLVVLLSLIPLIKHLFLASFLRHSNMSRGAKDATQTLIGYLFFAIAIFIALSIAGVNFKNIAIVAGALSVGIGFGLQNIVNNFVSGIILLFERPIRRGDWIVVGNTEGYVKDISIRSTVIQTFQNADVIVPNSELISNQVTNWMLSNNIGQLRLPVGVAYGTDTSKVVEILEEVATNHPSVISGHPDYPVKVLFLEFADSSLNFELDCFLLNIDMRRNIKSDLNLAIDKAFRKHGIEIPFPQRVIHMAEKPSSDSQQENPSE